MRSAMAAVLLTLTVLPCSGQTVPLPNELSFLKDPFKPFLLTYETWADVQTYGPNGAGKIVWGKHWRYALSVPGGKTLDQIWSIVTPAFFNNGWTAVWERTAGGRMLSMRYAKDGVEAWATFGVPGFERAGVEVVEAAPQPVTLTLAAPAATPEIIDPARGDFPYLGPIPGTTFKGGAAEVGPFYVTPKGATAAELVAHGSIDKVYRADNMSNSLFRIVYHDALTRAGWTIVEEHFSADGIITAHYTQNGRNIWARLHKSGGYDIRVADVGAVTKDLASDLAKNCHMAMYGILFDFNKSTLQPASDPVLQQILSLLTKDAALKLEIQGHTDNVGNDAYNQTLSEARAAAVVAWLTQHGMVAGRLTARGFGKTVPVADNSTDAGRARNRRVEIADPRCAAKGK